MTGQTLLNYAELVNNELLLQSGEADVTRGLLALNVAQDFFESLVARRQGVLGVDTTTTVTTTASTETTAFPTGYLRIDALQLLDSNSRPKRDLTPIKQTGGHAFSAGWPSSLISISTSGEPEGYFTNGRLIYWSPLPNGTHTVRVYGFPAASDITAAGTFAYPDVVAFPLAVFAAKIIASGLDDDVLNLDALAGATFSATIDALDNFDRDGGTPFNYTRPHDT